MYIYTYIYYYLFVVALNFGKSVQNYLAIRFERKKGRVEVELNRDEDT